MSKKLSDLFFEKKVKLVGSGTPEFGQYLHQFDARTYGEICSIEAKIESDTGTIWASLKKELLHEIALREGIKDYKI